MSRIDNLSRLLLKWAFFAPNPVDTWLIRLADWLRLASM